MLRVLSVALCAAATSGVILENYNISATFDTDKTKSTFGNLEVLRAVKGSTILRNGTSPLWTVKLADKDGNTEDVSSATDATRTFEATATTLVLHYSNIKSRLGVAGLSVDINIELDGKLLNIHPSFRGDGTVTLASWAVQVNRIALQQSSKVLENYGFGIVHDCGTGFSAPDAYQRAGSSGDVCQWSEKTDGYYVPGCPDGSTSGCPSYLSLVLAKAACEKELRCTGITSSGYGYQLRGGSSLQPSPPGSNEASWVIYNYEQCHPGVHLSVACGNFGPEYPSATYQYMASYDSAVPFSGFYMGTHDSAGNTKGFNFNVQQSYPATGQAIVTSVVPDSGLPLNNVAGNFVVTLSVFDGDWWDSAQIYRAWALPNAEWTKLGPVSGRQDIPSWLNNVPVWVNSHWQGNDIFNTSGGDPQVVQQRVLAVQDRFGVKSKFGADLGLHWYEWDTLGYEEGSNYSKCGSEVTCGFDTHYPEYFPTRQGFQGALKTMQGAGVRVAPYINGRIFDIDTKKWGNDQATKFAAKNLQYPRLNPKSSDLSNYYESYGSEARFNVMCPHTDYWQDTISDVTQELVNTYGVDGVYLDQIASAGPRPCWDASHNHTLGGGSHWVSGYREMMLKARQKQKGTPIYLTESNAEPFMDVMTVYLTLVGYATAPFVGERSIANVFNAIYGGYYYGMGAEFYTTDFVPNPDVFSSKIAKQLLYGGLMGWFSLGGRNNQNPPMGIYDQLMDSQYDPEVSYLQKLTEARLKVSDFFVNGRTGRDLVLNTGAPMKRHPAHPRGSTPKHEVGAGQPLLGVSYREVMSSTFLSADSKQLLCVITNIARNSNHTYSFTVDPSHYQLYGVSYAPVYELVDYYTGKMIAKFTDEPVTHTATIASHDVHLLVITTLV
eukprot:TRINITY_DN7162_c0_g1_i2.p1 TRINITY_DN7162_c0_g1~~TRINITY_DN7162_c0_g1_i2.p1  ORF type:complete len:906 (+),score=269.64 TRINITY_DN7162_c0_g1_i2:50-2719(+)